MDISIYLQVLLQQPDGWWKHHLRTQIRFAFWEQASRTRKDSVGMHAGLDYEASSRPGRSKIFHCRYLPRELNLLRRFLVGSTPTRIRLHKAKRAERSYTIIACGCNLGRSSLTTPKKLRDKAGQPALRSYATRR